MSELIRFKDQCLTLPIQYFGSVRYYALMSSFGNIVIADNDFFDKRKKSAHRTTIIDTRARLQLTVPICKIKNPGSRLRWCDIPVSDHGEWWNIHRVSLESAYGRTPFFEFYIDRLLPFFSQSTVSSFESVSMLDVALNDVICEILGIEGSLKQSSSLQEPIPSIHPDRIDGIKDSEYYQIRKSKFGFIPDLSILDLIFNMGPESPLVLRAMTEALYIRQD